MSCSKFLIIHFNFIISCLGRVIDNADLSKKTAAGKLEKQRKNLPKRKSKEKSVGEKRVLVSINILKLDNLTKSRFLVIII